MSSNDMVTILTVVLIALMFIVMVLIAIFVTMKVKEKKEKKDQEVIKYKDAKDTVVKSNSKQAKEYETKSIFDFMEFENVKDNMIVQKRWKKIFNGCRMSRCKL